MRKQLRLARQVHCCYEAGAGGFVLHRQLTELGAINRVVAPRKLDRDNKGVQNDSLDARGLVLDLDRFVRGNPKALRLVHVPTPAQHERRQSAATTALSPSPRCSHCQRPVRSTRML